MTINAWGQPIEQTELPDDIYYVPPEQRLDHDDDPSATALTNLITGEQDDDLS